MLMIWYHLYTHPYRYIRYVFLSKCMAKCWCCRQRTSSGTQKKNIVYLFAAIATTKWNQNTGPPALALVHAPRASPLDTAACDLSRAEPQESLRAPLRQPDVMLNLNYVATEIRMKTRRMLRLALRHVRCCDWGVRYDSAFPLPTPWGSPYV